MPGHVYTIEELMLNDSFIDYCLSKGTAIPSRWKTIIRENPDQEKTFEEAKRLVHALHGGLSRPEVNRQIEIVRRQIEGRKDRKEKSTKKEGPVLSAAFVITRAGQIKKRLLKTAVYSAVGLLILMAGISWWFVMRSSGDSEVPAVQLTQAQNYHSPLGERKKIDLPDGSFVILNSNSTISITFTNKKRAVQLKGDAFFRVAKDPSKPFTVYSEKIAATALGTEFYVHASHDETDKVQVDLLEGKVQVAEIAKGAIERKIILSPGESGIYCNDLLLKKSSYDTVFLRSWIGGRIVFKNTPLKKAIRELENWYGVKIRVDNPNIKDVLINGDYSDNVSLPKILEMIGLASHGQYTFRDDIVVIDQPKY